MALKDIQSLLVEQPESGSARPSDESMSGQRWTRVYAFRKQYLSTVRKSVEKNEHDLDGEGYLVDYDIKGDAAYCLISAIYNSSATLGDQSISSKNKPINKPQYFRTKAQDDIPVERLKGYYTCWNYCLAADSETDTIPSWAADRTTTSLSKIEGEHYQWVKDSSQLKEGWHIILPASMPGLDAKLNFRAVVREIVWCLTASAAGEYCCDKVTLGATPDEKYGISGGTWLMLPSEVSPDGSLWRIETEYWHSPAGWKSLIYNAEEIS